MQKSRIFQDDKAAFLSSIYRNLLDKGTTLQDDFKNIFYPVIDSALKDVFEIMPMGATKPVSDERTKITDYDRRALILKIINELAVYNLYAQTYFMDVFETPVTKALQETFEITPA